MCFFGAEMNAIENHIADFQNLAANVKMIQEQEHSVCLHFFLIPLVMAGCTRKDFMCITFGCSLRSAHLYFAI